MTFIVIIHRHRQRTLGRILTNNIFIQEIINLGWRWQFLDILADCATIIIRHNIITQIDTFITDTDITSTDQLFYFINCLATETAKLLVIFHFWCFIITHICFPIQTMNYLRSKIPSIRPKSLASLGHIQLSRSIASNNSFSLRPVNSDICLINVFLFF